MEVLTVPGTISLLSLQPLPKCSPPDQTLHVGGLFPQPLGRAHGLIAPADPLEPEMQAELVGDAHSAMDFGCRARDETRGLGQTGLGMKAAKGRVGKALVE